MEDINGLLEHFKIKPTYVVLNTIHIILKNNGYRDIPKVQFLEPNGSVCKNSIDDYCCEIEKLINSGHNSGHNSGSKSGSKSGHNSGSKTGSKPGSKIEDKRKNYKEIHMFQESSMLPQNVYISEKKDEEKMEDDYVEEDITSSSESENSVDTGPEEGYDIYEENEEDEFSE